MKKKFFGMFAVATIGIVPFTVGGTAVYANESYKVEEAVEQTVTEDESLIERVASVKEETTVHSY